MGYVDQIYNSIFGAPTRKLTSGPHVTRLRKNAARKKSLAEMDAQYAAQDAIKNLAKPAADPVGGLGRIRKLAKEKAAKEALKKKQKDTGAY